MIVKTNPFIKEISIHISTFERLSSATTSFLDKQDSNVEKFSMRKKLNIINDKLTLNQNRGSSQFSLEMVSATLRKLSIAHKNTSINA